MHIANLFLNEHLHPRRKLRTEFNCNPVTGFDETTVKLKTKRVPRIRITNATEFV